MGSIAAEVKADHLRYYPEEEQLLAPFLDCFDVTWARRRKQYNTELSVFFLKPNAKTSDAFGIGREIMLAYSQFSTMEARGMQAASAMLSDSPAKGRVEVLSYILISEAPNIAEWVDSYLASNQDHPIVVALSADGVRAHAGDEWYVPNILSDQFYGRDLFDFRLPLNRDADFFGRRELLGRYYDAMKRSENKGIFGLRKTGKTSVLNKLERMARADGLIEYLSYDCKSPSIRSSRWFELLERVGGDICERFDISPKRLRFDPRNAADSFVSILRDGRVSKRVTLVFDEVEFISFLSTLDIHWHDDFIPFWQTFWMAQSQQRKLMTIVAGVNPCIIEADSVNGVQNPLFAIVSSEYLRGFTDRETEELVRTLGKRMGLTFTPDAIKYLHGRYGGHPLLTRLACSLANGRAKDRGERRPLSITGNILQKTEDERDNELMFYCGHVVSELSSFYPDEYVMMELLASRQTADFLELASEQEYVRHLRNYGLLDMDHGTARLTIPAVEKFVGLEVAKRDGRKTILKVIEPSGREAWLKRRTSAILHDTRTLERLITDNREPPLYGINSFPEGDKFVGLSVCQDYHDFISFINVCNRCFVESIDLYGRSTGSNDYFFSTIRGHYPALFDALHRVRVYRHDQDHLTLNAAVSDKLKSFLDRDLEGRSVGNTAEPYFVLQQCVLDGLLAALQVELSKMS